MKRVCFMKLSFFIYIKPMFNFPTKPSIFPVDLIDSIRLKLVGKARLTRAAKSPFQSS